MRLSVLGSEVDVSHQTIRSDRLYADYGKLSSDLLSDFDTDYDTAAKEPRLAPSLLDQFCWEKVDKALETLLDRFIQANVFDHDLTSLTVTYDELGLGQSLRHQLAAVEAQTDAIFVNEQELDAYRSARRQGRSRLVGGGFGIKGAAEGLAIAGVANTVTNVASGTFNFLAKAGSTVVARSDAKQILSNARQHIRDGLQLAIQDIYSVDCTVLRRLGPDAYDDESGRSERCRRAATIFENTKRAQLKGFQLVQNILLCISLDTQGGVYYRELLASILSNGGDATDISRLRQFCVSCAVDLDECIERTFEQFALSSRTEYSFEDWSTVLDGASRILSYDYSAFSNKIVAERFVTEVARAGLQKFLEDHTNADMIIGPDAKRMPSDRTGVISLLNLSHKTEVSKFAREFAEAALKGDQRCVKIAAADSTKFVLGFLNHRDTTAFGMGVGSNAFQSAKEKLLNGKFDLARSRQLVSTLSTFADEFFADGEESRNAIEEYGRKRDLVEAELKQQKIREAEQRTVTANREAMAITKPAVPTPASEKQKAVVRSSTRPDTRTADPTIATATRKDDETAARISSHHEVGSKRKWVAFALALSLGVLGGHRVYLRSFGGAAFFIVPILLVFVLSAANLNNENILLSVVSTWILTLPVAALVDAIRIVALRHDKFMQRYAAGSQHTWRLWL